MVIDYFSRFIELKKLTLTTATNIIITLKAIFSRYGIPVTLMSDNGPQFACKEMEEFATEYGFEHITSSPHYPQSNGLVERAVRTVKDLLEHATDPYMALLAYRATPLPWCHLSPAELLMGRKLRTDVPQVESHFIPQWTYLESFKESDRIYKKKQKKHYDKRKRVRFDLPDLKENTPVWVNTNNGQIPGTVVQPASTPRSYMVNVPTGQLHRTRRDLRPRVVNEKTNNNIEEEQPRTIATRSHTGTRVLPLDQIV